MPSRHLKKILAGSAALTAFGIVGAEAAADPAVAFEGHSALSVPMVPEEKKSDALVVRPDNTLVSAEHTQRLAAGAALGALIAAFVRLVGPNRLLNMIANFGTFFTCGASRAGDAAKAAGAKAAQLAGNAVAAPGRVLLVIAGLSIFALTGISLMDIEWQAGLAIGAAAGVAAGHGWSRMSKRAASLLDKVSAFRLHPQSG